MNRCPVGVVLLTCGTALFAATGAVHAQVVEAAAIDRAASANGSAPASPTIELPAGYVGPLPPLAPDVVTRDAEGRAAVRAVRVTQPMRIDGQLDEAVYRDVPPMSDFIQMEPQAGAPATERTEVWLSFDDDHVYVSFRCWERSMERAGRHRDAPRQHAASGRATTSSSFIFDTFYDRRNAIAFTVNPLGGRSDGQVVNERQYSGDWNPVWELKTGRFEGGWTVESRDPVQVDALPTRARHRSGASTPCASSGAKNEISIADARAAARGQHGIPAALACGARWSASKAPAGGRSLDLKPYRDLERDDAIASRRPRDLERSLGGDVGLDAKYGVTQNLTADFTYNTDFAQVEADEQQVNLTRFSLFFPEKREFFLENQGTFAFGGVAVGSFDAAAATRRFSSTAAASA